MPRIQIKRGLRENLPNSGMLPGEQFFSTDRGSMHVATNSTTRLPVVPPLEDLPTLDSVDSADLMMIHDSSATSGRREKAVAVSVFRSALGIPEDTPDEKVALVAGGLGGYLWGTDGTDGMIRMGPSLTWEKDPFDRYVTLHVHDIDGGLY